MREEYSDKALWFVAGAAIGATLALLFAPASGEVTRRRLGRAAASGKDYMAEAGRDMMDQGRGLFDKGRKLADDAAELFERGKKMVEG